MNLKSFNTINLNILPAQTNNSRLLLRIFWGVLLLISISSCSKTYEHPKTGYNEEASINKISFTVDGKTYDASISEENTLITVSIPSGSTIPTEVKISELEKSSQASTTASQGDILKVSDGKATISVTSEDGITTRIFSIIFVAIPYSEASITELVLKVSGKNETIDFDQDGNASIEFPYGTTIPEKVKVETLTNSTKANTSVKQGADLEVSDGKATITVTSEDGETKKTYTINFVVLPASTEALLKRLVLEDIPLKESETGDKTIDFDQDDNGSIVIPYGTDIPTTVKVKSLNYSAEADSDVPENNELAVSDGQATIIITAQDGETTNTYTIHFIPEVKVTFDANGGTTIIEELILKKGSKSSIPTDPTPPNNKSFGYWGSSKDSNADYRKNVFDFDTAIDDDITIYAVWKEKPADKAALVNLVNAAITNEILSPDLSFIDTSLVTDMSALFKDKTTFNGDISEWDTSQVTNMENVFQRANAFNGDISKWDTSKVTTMQTMFSSAKAFNQDISEWVTSQVTNMESMFNTAEAFNQDIGGWDTSKVTNMDYMFSMAKNFDQDISRWEVGQVTTYTAIFKDSGIENKDNFKPERFR